MEWPSRGHPSVPCRSATRLPREFQGARLCFDAQLLRRRELATHPRSARFLWGAGHSAHWNVPLSNGGGATGAALGSVVHPRAGQSCTLCANVHPAHGDPAARGHRMGFAPSFRWSSLSRLEMVRSGTDHRVSESLPLQASTKLCLLNALRFYFSLPLLAAADPSRMGSGQHKLRGRGTRRPRFRNRILHSPIYADCDSRVPRDSVALPGTP